MILPLSSTDAAIVGRPATDRLPAARPGSASVVRLDLVLPHPRAARGAVARRADPPGRPAPALGARAAAARRQPRRVDRPPRRRAVRRAPPVSAVTQVHRQISELRALLDPERSRAAMARDRDATAGVPHPRATRRLDLQPSSAARTAASAASPPGTPSRPRGVYRRGADAVARRAARRSRVRAVRACRRRAAERAALSPPSSAASTPSSSWARRASSSPSSRSS